MRDSFYYRDKELFVEDVPVNEIIRSVGTPCYIYSVSALNQSFRLYKDAFSSINPLICFSVKANSNIAVLRAFARLGAGFDIVSGGELFRVLKAGGEPRKIVFSGVGKTKNEMKEAITKNILFFNVESSEELETLNLVAKGLNKKARVAIRVNPDIDPKTHPYISTGLKKSKFGIEIVKALEVYRRASSLRSIDVVGIDAHIGSQIFDLKPFVESLRKLVQFASTLKDNGIEIKYIDIGGGLGIRYEKEENPPDPKRFAEAIYKEIKDKPYRLIIEPGRSLIGNAGILVTRVIYLKEGGKKKFVIVDAAMNDLIRPAFYDSYHEVLPARLSNGGSEVVDIVGPVCESGDFFAKDRRIKMVKKDELLVIMSAGAYGFVMSSNYNTRPRIAEVIVKGDRYSVVRQRERIRDLVRGESIPDFIK